MCAQILSNYVKSATCSLRIRHAVSPAQPAQPKIRTDPPTDAWLPELPAAMLGVPGTDPDRDPTGRGRVERIVDLAQRRYREPVVDNPAAGPEAVAGAEVPGPVHVGDPGRLGDMDPADPDPRRSSCDTACGFEGTYPPRIWPLITILLPHRTRAGLIFTASLDGTTRRTCPDVEASVVGPPLKTASTRRDGPAGSVAVQEPLVAVATTAAGTNRPSPLFGAVRTVTGCPPSATPA